MNETKAPPIDLSNTVAVADAVEKNKGKPVQISVYFLTGIFGELENCNGIAEEVIVSDEQFKKYGLDPAEGGTYIKILGCSYLYKGDPEQSKVFGMEQAKSNISNLPMMIIGKSALYSAAVILRALLQRKRFVHDLHIFFEEIRHKTIRHTSPPEIRMRKSVREIRRALDIAIKETLGIAPIVDLANQTDPSTLTSRRKIFGTTLPRWIPFARRYEKLDLAAMIFKAMLFVTLIMERDGAYCFPMQDILGEADKENAKRSGTRELMRLFDLMLERQTNLTPVEGFSKRTQGVPHKFRFLKRAARLFLFISPTARKIVQRFLVELDTSKVALDDADWYYCLRRDTHNYRGTTLKERLDELERIDAERGHQYIKMEFRPLQAGEKPNVTVVLDQPKP